MAERRGQLCELAREHVRGLVLKERERIVGVTELLTWVWSLGHGPEECGDVRFGDERARPNPREARVKWGLCARSEASATKKRRDKREGSARKKHHSNEYSVETSALVCTTTGPSGSRLNCE